MWGKRERLGLSRTSSIAETNHKILFQSKPWTGLLDRTTSDADAKTRQLRNNIKAAWFFRMGCQHKCMTVTWSKTHFKKYSPERIDIQVIEGAIKSEVFQGMGLRSRSNSFNTSRLKQFWDVLSLFRHYKTRRDIFLPAVENSARFL